ncbi:MAG: twin-arginine translocase TatA/TatE family subunit [Sphingomonas sp.]|nr:MAG: twin-arginine translocase TatA/TatE family subunit [Sphingomonas sp.]
MGGFSPIHLLVLAVVAILLLGAQKTADPAFDRDGNRVRDDRPA